MAGRLSKLKTVPAVVALLLALAACGDGGDEPADEGNGNNPTSEVEDNGGGDEGGDEQGDDGGDDGGEDNDDG